MSSLAKLEWILDAESKEIAIFRAGPNRKVVLRRPKNGNALTTDMVHQLSSFFRDAASNDAITRIIITAEGKLFCTGMDLGKSSTAVSSKGDGAATSEYQKFLDLFDAIQEAPQVTIAAINGPCYAGGIGLAFSCDIRLAVSSASCTLSEVRLGLCPAIISKLLAREWGLALTREAMLSARSISMPELQNVGSVHGLAKDPIDLERMTDAYIDKLRFCAPKASAYCKEVAKVAYLHPGQPKQQEVIKRIFGEMMAPGSESTTGVGNFQRKIKTDWDSLNRQQKGSKL